MNHYKDPFFTTEPVRVFLVERGASNMRCGLKKANSSSPLFIGKNPPKIHLKTEISLHNLQNAQSNLKKSQADEQMKNKNTSLPNNFSSQLLAKKPHTLTVLMGLSGRGLKCWTTGIEVDHIFGSLENGFAKTSFKQGEKKLHLYTEVNIIYPLLPRIYLLAIDREPITPFTGEDDHPRQHFHSLGLKNQNPPTIHQKYMGHGASGFSPTNPI